MKIKLVTALAPLEVASAINITTVGSGATPGTIVSAAFSTSGDGTGATFDVIIGAAGTATTCTVTAGGDDFAVGDTVTFATAVVGGTVAVVATIAKEDLDIDNNLGIQAIIPVDDIYCVVPEGDGDTVSLEQLQVEHNRKWLLTINGGGTGNYAAIGCAVNACVIASQRDPLSMPVLGGDDFPLPDGVTITRAELS